MKKLFDAIQSRHPGFDVVDVRFLVSQWDVDNQAVDELDAALAEVVEKSEAIQPAFD